MTPADKLALARRSYAAFSAGPDIEALLPLFHPECEWRVGYIGAALGNDVFRGHDGLREIVTAIDEGFESYVVEIDEAKTTREGVLLLRFHNQARSRGTHMELSLRAYQVIESSDGLILSVAQLHEPPAGWDEATPLDLGLTPDTGT